MLGVALMLGGGVVAALGLFFIGFGIYSIAAGYGFGHAEGWSMLLPGCVFAASGLWATRRGRKIYDAVAS